MKRKFIAFLAAVLAAALGCHASESYGDLLKKAKEYEANGLYIYALGTYFDAIEAEKGDAEEAVENFERLGAVVENGTLSNGKPSAEFRAWEKLCKEFEKYFTEHIPVYFEFSKPECTDMSTRTFTTVITPHVTYKFNYIFKHVNRGYAKSWNKAWAHSLGEDWPISSAYQSEWETLSKSKNSSAFFKDGVALMTRPDDYSSQTLYAAAVKGLFSRRDDGSGYSSYVTVINDVSDKNRGWFETLYDIKLNIVDKKGTVLAQGERKLVAEKSRGYEGKSDIKYDFKSVGAKVADMIDFDEAFVSPAGVYLEYGLLEKYKYYDAGSRDWIKPLPEKSYPLSAVHFVIEGQKSTYRDLFQEKATRYYLKKNKDGFVPVLLKDGDSGIMMLSTEVTQEFYEYVTDKNPSKFKGRKRPVEQVTWLDAVRFCNRLSDIAGLTPVYKFKEDKWGNVEEVSTDTKADGYRLPTKDEWMYAARESYRESLYAYSGSDNIDEVAWYRGNSGTDGPDVSDYSSDRSTHEVALKKPNALGLYDMSGNVKEWVNDYDKDYTGSGTVPFGGDYNSSEDWGPNLEHTGGEVSSIWSGTSEVGFRIVRNATQQEIAGEKKKNAEFNGQRKKEVDELLSRMFVPVKNTDGTFLMMAKTETTQKLYTLVTKKNPSEFKGENRPVERVSFYDAVLFCNALSEMAGLMPVYSYSEKVTGSTDYNEDAVRELKDLSVKENANGFRLPTKSEWTFAKNETSLLKAPFKYSGSDDEDEVSWHDDNSGETTHDVALKKPNALGLYDMSGNVSEWVWDIKDGDSRCAMGDSYSRYGYRDEDYYSPSAGGSSLGFRIVRTASDSELAEQKAALEKKKAEEKAAREMDAAAMSIPPLMKKNRSEYAVSQWLWWELMGSNPSAQKNFYAPVTGMSYYEAVVFCNRLSERTGLTPVYELNKTADTRAWGKIPTGSSKTWDKMKVNKKANGYMLEFESAKKFTSASGKGFFVKVQK